MLFTHGLCLDGISPRQAARRGVYATFEEQGRHNMNESEALACSPWLAATRIRFLSIGSRFRYSLPPHDRSTSRRCDSLRSLWSARRRTSTSKIAPMLGAQKNQPAQWAGWFVTARGL